MIIKSAFACVGILLVLMVADLNADEVNKCVAWESEPSVTGAVSIRMCTEKVTVKRERIFNWTHLNK